MTPFQNPPSFDDLGCASPPSGGFQATHKAGQRRHRPPLDNLALAFCLVLPVRLRWAVRPSATSNAATESLAEGWMSLFILMVRNHEANVDRLIDLSDIL